jgi:hypothetical protein
MENVRKTAEYTIFKKRNGRYCIQDSKCNWLLADKKIEILKKEKLIKLSVAKQPKPDPQPQAEKSSEPKAEKPTE